MRGFSEGISTSSSTIILIAQCAWLAVITAGTLVPFIWYDRVRADRGLDWGLGVTAVVTAAWCALLPWLLPEMRSRARRGMGALIVVTWISLALSTAFERGDAPASGALLQVAFLVVLAWTCAQLGRLRAFHVLTALIALRVLVIYFEVFGSMLSTGLGLITGGILTLLMAWAWRRKSTHLAQQLAGAPVASADPTSTEGDGDGA